MFLLFGLFYLVIFAVSIGGLIVWIWMVIDAATRPAWQFPDARPESQNKILWILVVALGGWIGALIYYFMIYKTTGKANSSLPAPPWWFYRLPPYPQPDMAYPGQPYPQASPPFASQPGTPPPYPQPGVPNTGQPYSLHPGFPAPAATEAPSQQPGTAKSTQTPPVAETQRLPQIKPPPHEVTRG